VTGATIRARGVHLVGSVPLASSEDVFTVAAAILGPYLRRIPDGETGVRSGWIGWQNAVFAGHAAFERGAAEPGLYGDHAFYRLRDRGTATDLTFGSLGYADAALASYETFERLKQNRVVPSSARFQVSLPTPMAPLSNFVALDDRALVEPAYEQRLLAELSQILTTIPHDQLAIQWDVAVEVALLEGVAPTHLSHPWEDIGDRLVQLGCAVPPDVELGYHWCYGDAGHRHFKEPNDAGLVVRLTNAVVGLVERPLTWIHLPAPRSRTDDAYFAPLEALRLSSDTEVYLGLVHAHDGLAGARRRLDAAERHLATFGIATECGLGRRPPETIPDLLRLHAAVAELPTGHAAEI
jgi:hypothetical protein